MKKFRLFAYAALAGLTLGFAACSDDETTDNGEQVIRGEKCRIETFVLTLSDGSTLIGDVYDYDKSIDLSYNITQLAGMSAATATVTLSEGATISPDPSIAADYMEPVSFTVTGADGKTTRTYTTRAVERVVQTYTKVDKLTEKSASAMGVGNSDTYKQIGVSGTNLVIKDKVFNGRTLAEVGTLNMTGLDGLSIISLTNDDAGHLIASMSASGDNTPPVSFYCWKNGYNQPAELILGPSASAIGNLISVSGNIVKGKALVTAMGGQMANGPHFCWEFLNGVRTGNYDLTTGRPTNDGSYSQMVSPCSGDVTGQWFLWDANPGNGSYIGAWSQWSGEGAIQLMEIPGVITESGGDSNWGNLRLGSVRGFTFNKTAYGACFVLGWGSTYVAIVDGNGEYLLNPKDSQFTASHTGSTRPVGTYVLNPTDNCGYVYVLDPGEKVVAWKLEIAIE